MVHIIDVDERIAYYKLDTFHYAHIHQTWSADQLIRLSNLLSPTTTYLCHQLQPHGQSDGA